MPLACPSFTLTWYPGEYPSDTGAVVLQSADHYVDDAAGFGAAVEDLVQTAEFLRGSAPAFYNRGNRTTRLEWEEVRRYASPAEAMAAGLEIAAAMPSASGWLRIDLPDLYRAWKAEPCMIQRVAFPQPARDGRATLLRIQWTLLIGPLAEIPGDFSGLDILMLETGYPLEIAAGEYLYLS